MGLHEVTRWDEALPLKLLLARIESLNMADQFSLTPDIIDELPGRLIAVYKLWKYGEDLRGMFAWATFYRYRKELLKHGIDIAVPQPQMSENVIPLVRVFRPEVIAQLPNWESIRRYISIRAVSRLEQVRILIGAPVWHCFSNVH